MKPSPIFRHKKEPLRHEGKGARLGYFLGAGKGSNAAAYFCLRRANAVTSLPWMGSLVKSLSKQHLIKLEDAAIVPWPQWARWTAPFGECCSA